MYVTTAAVVVAVVGVLLALYQGAVSRRDTRTEAQRRFELNLLMQALIEFETPDTHKAIGATPQEEAAAAADGARKNATRHALIAAIGPELLPVSWALVARTTEAELESRAKARPSEGDDTTKWERCAAEAASQIRAIRREVDRAPAAGAQRAISGRMRRP